MRARALFLVGLICAAMPTQSQEFTTLKGHGGPIMDISVNAETGQVATASFDNSVGLWEGRAPTWVEGHEAAVIALDFWGKNAIVSGGDDFFVRLRSFPYLRSEVIGWHKGKVTAIAVSYTAEIIASASWDGTIGLWPRTAPVSRVVLYPPLSSEGQQSIYPRPDGRDFIILEGHRQGVNDVVFSKDGTRIYSASSDGTIRKWNIEKLPDAVNSRVLVSNGFGINKLVVNEAKGWLAYGAVDGVTRVIDPESGDTIADFTLERRPILSMAYHAETDQLAVGDGQGYIMMIDTAEWRIARDFRAMRQGPVWALDFGPDGKAIYAGGIEDVVFSWPVAFLDEYDPAGGDTRSVSCARPMRCLMVSGSSCANVRSAMR